EVGWGWGSRAMSTTLLPPCEWPTSTSRTVLPAARSLTTAETADFQKRCPIASALMPLPRSSSAMVSMPVVKMPNQPRSRYTRVSAWSSLHQSTARAPIVQRTAVVQLTRTRAPRTRAHHLQLEARLCYRLLQPGRTAGTHVEKVPGARLSHPGRLEGPELPT